MADHRNTDDDQTRAAKDSEAEDQGSEPVGILVDRETALDWVDALTSCLGAESASGAEPVSQIRIPERAALALASQLKATLDSSAVPAIGEAGQRGTIEDGFLLTIRRQTALDLLKGLERAHIRHEPFAGLALAEFVVGRQTATDIFLAFMTGLGSVPAAASCKKGKKAKKDYAKGGGKGWAKDGGKGWAKDGGKGGKGGSFERMDDLPGGGEYHAPGEPWPNHRRAGGPDDKRAGGPDDTRDWKRAKPPMPAARRPARKQRYVNLWFTENLPGKPRIDRNLALELGKEICLRVNIGPFDARHIMAVEAARAFVSEKTIAAAFPETVGKPVPLEATVFSNHFDVPDEARTQKFDLIHGQPTAALFFPVTPLRKGRSQLRLCIFYKNHLLQSLAVSADINEQAAVGQVPQTVAVEMTFSADFTNAAKLPARGLWLGINQSQNNTHTLNIKNSQKALTRDLQDKIETALRRARRALREVSFNEVADHTGAKKKVYRFDSNNFPNVPPKEHQERFRQDLTKLAVAGNGLYQALFGFIPLAKERDKVQPIVEELKTTLREEQIIQIARLKHMEDIWPWALVYDVPVDPKKVTGVCVSYRGKNGRALPYREGVKDCLHAQEDDTIVCPYNFWGFKHIVEQPTQPGGKEAFDLENLVLEIKPGANPVFQMLLETTLGKNEPHHVDKMKSLNFKALTSFDEITAALNPKSQPTPAEPHLMYFFCHGKSDDEQGPYLSVGADESLLPAKLDHWNFRWPNSHGLVFINGCHTVDMEPSELSSIMQPFVAACASGIIGTEISVTTGLAREFGYEFFSRFLAKDDKVDRRVGQVIKDLRLNLLMKYNPLGLVYTPYCSADLHMAQ